MEIKVNRSSGIIRRIDDLGRIVIPKEIRHRLHIREGMALEINLCENGMYIEKYSNQSGENLLNWVINNKYSKGNKHSVISKISECINPNAKRKRAFGFEWFCDNYATETKNKFQINQYNLAGKYIATHSSAIEAARSLGEDALLACHIREVCKNQRKTAKGFIWKYAV